MSVYLVSAGKASCRVSGCVCRDRVPRYPSDLTNEQWELLEPEARAVLAELRKGPGGAPMSHDLRAMLDAIGYVTRYGVEWRALPADFPPWSAVYAFFERWSARGLPRRLVDRLRGRIRIACGRAELPTAAVIDAQTVRGADTVAAASAGYDAGKKTKGRKRNIATDCLGLLLMVTVTAASVQDRDGAHRLLALLRERFSTISLVWADGGYAGRLVTWAKAVLHLTITIVKRTDDIKGFVVLPRRWVVERTFGWLTRHRRLVRDYERKPEHHEAMVWWATVAIMTRRLTRELADRPPPPRWGQPRPSRSLEPAT
jgi:transposase